MAIDWDPTSGRRGLDWPVVRKGGSVIDATRAAAIRVPPTATQTVTDVSVYLDRVVGTAIYRLDVWKASDLPATLTTATFRPNEDVTTTSWSASTGSSFFALVDEATLDKSDYIRRAASGGNLEIRVASTGGLGAGTQIVYAVRIKAVVESKIDTTGLTGHSVKGRLNLGGTVYLSGATTVGPTDGAATVEFEWTENPSTGAAWTEADVVALDATDEIGLTVGVVGSGAPTASDWITVYQLWVEVDYVNDLRLATADLSVSASGWQTFDTASFTKTNAETEIIVLRRISGSGAAVLPSLDSGSTMPGSHGAYRPSIDTRGNVSSLNALLTECHPVIFHIAGPAASADSQPYVDMVRTPISTGVTVEQEITAEASNTRQWVNLVLGSTRHAIPSAALSVKVRKRSDSSQVGGTGTIPAAYLEEGPYVLRAMEAVLASGASVTNGTQYYLELSSTAATGEGWDTVYLDALAPPVSGYTAGFGGSTDRATVATAESDDRDFPFVYATVPTAPAGFSAT